METYTHPQPPSGITEDVVAILSPPQETNVKGMLQRHTHPAPVRNNRGCGHYHITTTKI